MRRVDNEEGIAYALIAAVAFIIMAGLIVIVLTPGIAQITEVYNDIVDRGEISHATAGPVMWSLSLFGAISIIAIFGITVWVYIRALERRET